ncbi:amidohydrolase [Halomonas nitroreducens]|nr:amidohydrolase [Halomonas nitroreducens]
MRIALPLVGCLALVSPLAFAAGPASLLLHGGQIYTVDAERAWASALAIGKDGRLLAVGNAEDMSDVVDAATERVDLKGRLVLPGFQDTHAHVLDASSAAQGDCLLDSRDGVARWLDDLAACNATDDGDWLLGAGFALHPLLAHAQSPRALLDRVIPDRPVAMMEETSHAYWLNTAALRRAGIDADTPDPAGGVILRDAAGEPTGLVLDNAGDLALDAALTPSPVLDATYYRAVLAGQDELARHGITSVADARVFWRRGHLEAWQRAARNDALKARTVLGLWAYPGLDDDEQLARLEALYAPAGEDELLSVSQIKFYVDGIVHNTTARLHEPYDESLPGVDPGGLYYFTPARLERYARELAATGFDLHIHTIGDQAVSDALDAIAATDGQGRHRLTHVELVRPEDVPRFAALDVTADFQPSEYFTTPYLDGYRPLIGARARQLLPMRRLHDAGARLTLSSDWDVNPLSPLGIMQSALSLGERSLPSLAAAVRAYTLDAAYVLGQEDDTGSLEVGKQADLVVLDRNIFELPVTRLDEARVLWTLLGGEEVYRDAAF